MVEFFNVSAISFIRMVTCAKEHRSCCTTLVPANHQTRQPFLHSSRGWHIRVALECTFGMATKRWLPFDGHSSQARELTPGPELAVRGSSRVVVLVYRPGAGNASRESVLFGNRRGISIRGMLSLKWAAGFEVLLSAPCSSVAR